MPKLEQLSVISEKGSSNMNATEPNTQRDQDEAGENKKDSLFKKLTKPKPT